MSEPNLRLVIKLLMMTTSANDGEAITAMRKANKAVSDAGWDWDRLLSGKVTIVEDPFSKITPPDTTPHGKTRHGGTTAAPSAPQRPQPKPQSIASCAWCSGGVYDHSYVARGKFYCTLSCQNSDKPRTPTPPLRTRPQPTTTGYQRYQGPDLNPMNNINAHSQQPNQYTGHCWQCGQFVAANDGWIMRKTPVQRSNDRSTGAFLTLCGPCNAAGRPLPDNRARKAKVSTNDIFNSI